MSLHFSTDIKIVTKEVFNTDGKSQNWTNRAGSFLEQSRAFFDSYLGRWDRSNGEDMNDETIDDCTSGATSGEEVWGTPTSGENDEIQMFNSDQTHSVSDMEVGWGGFFRKFLHFSLRAVTDEIFVIADV